MSLIKAILLMIGRRRLLVKGITPLAGIPQIGLGGWVSEDGGREERERIEK